MPEVRLPTAGPITATEGHRMITIGIDPHKSTVTAGAVQDNGSQLGTIRLPVTTKLQDQLLLFASEWTDRQWAVEGATGLGLGVAQNLAAVGEKVLDVPAKLAARARLLATGHGRKTGPRSARPQLITPVGNGPARAEFIAPNGRFVVPTGGPGPSA